MKGLAKRLSLVVCAAAVVFAGCGNPWMKRITASLYDKPVTPGIPEVPGTPALPVLTGTVSIIWTLLLEGETLTADTTLLDGSGTVAYQWGQGDALAGPFTDIAFATAPDYTLQTADNGKYIVVTVTRDGYDGSVSSDPGLGPVGLPPLTGAVTVTGTPEVGQALTADPSSLGGSGTVSYQWRWSDVPAGPFADIASATASTYTLTAADNGKYIVVMVTRADNSGYVTSGVLGPVTLPVLTGTVTVAGTPEVGQTLTVNITLLGGSGTIGYQWRRGDAPAGPFTDISAAMASTYILQTADNGKHIVVTVTRTDNSGSVTSSPAIGPVTLPILTSAAAIGAYLATASGSPIDLLVNMNLSGSNWADLLLAIQGAGKFVNLNLSACTRSTGNSGGGLYNDGTFDPGTANTGESKIVSLVLPDAAESIKAGTSGNYTFQHFTGLTGIAGINIENVGELAFTSRTTLTSVNLSAVRTIGEGAFLGCTSLTAADFPVVETIGASAFLSCTGLTSVNLPSSLTNLGDGAFHYCTGLSSVNLPASLTTIDANPFPGCTGLTITVDPGNPNYSASGGMLLNKAGTTLIGWPAAAGTISLPGITSVGNAFYRCVGLISVTLPDVVTIDMDAFAGCTALTVVNLPAATHIDGRAFYYTGTTPLTVTLGAAVPTLGTGMFATAAKTVTVKVPNNAAWNGKTGTFSGTNTTGNWGNGFRGGGWNGSAIITSSVSDTGINSNITLTVEYE